MSFIPGTDIPNIPPNPLQDVASFGLQKVREALNRQRTQPAPTDKQLAERQAPIVRRSSGIPGSGEKSEIPGEFENRVDIHSEVFLENTGYIEQYELGESSTTQIERQEGKSFTSPSDRIDRDLCIIDTVSGKKLKLPFVPRELKYSPESHFKAIPSMGRNNPFYHFSGAEDTLEFEIDWFAEKDHRYDVILNCKWVEALSKNDAYDNPPPPIILHWNTALFSDSVWLVTAAPYRLLDFQAHRNMLPQQAYQQVTLKRITANNLSRLQIQSYTI